MGLLNSIEQNGFTQKAASWWQSKSKEEKLAIEQHIAIAAPCMGTLLGTALVFLIF